MVMSNIIYPDCFSADVTKAEDEEDGSWTVPVEVIDNDKFYAFLVDNNFLIDVLEEPLDVSPNDVIGQIYNILYPKNN